jgi:hypothetical protein
VVLGSRSDYGFLPITPEQRAKLGQLSKACGGWIVFDREKWETWLPLDEWEKRFDAWQRQSDRTEL